jgi:hypothetical protein
MGDLVPAGLGEDFLRGSLWIMGYCQRVETIHINPIVEEQSAEQRMSGMI